MTLCDGVGSGGMIDFSLFGGFGDRQMDRQTDEWTLVVVESLS